MVDNTILGGYMNQGILLEMHKAIKNNDLNTIKELVDNNKGILDETIPSGTFLQDAVTYGTEEIIKYILEQGVDVNQNSKRDEGNALADAAFGGRLDIVELLYTNGAILDVSTAAKNPLFAAIYNGHFDIVKFLVENGIDYKASYKIGSIENCDAYEYARQYGRTEIAEYLKEKMNEK